MIKRLMFVVFTGMVFFTGCIKETYNMNKIDKKIHYSPSIVMSVASGNIDLSNIVKTNDTINKDPLTTTIIDNNKLIRIIFRKDSVINLNLKDFYDFNNIVSYTKDYTVGVLKLDDFQSSLNLSLSQVSQSFSPALRTQFQSLNGTNNLFPAFPLTNLGGKSFSLISNFDRVIFSTGTLTLSVTNNLPAPLKSIRIQLINSSDNSLIGNEMLVPAIAAFSAQTVTMDLSGKSVTNSIIANIILNGSDGTATPVPINLNSTIQFRISATNLLVQSGRMILPLQKLSTVSNDKVTFNPGSNIEIEKLKITTGNVNYRITSSSSIRGSFSFTLPTAKTGGITPFTGIIQINSSNVTGNISLNNTEIDLSTDSSQRYNRIPIDSIKLSSNGNKVDFNSSDNLHFVIQMLNPVFDYLKGYFGQTVEQINQDSIDLDLDKVLKNAKDKFHVLNPSIRVNYSNSFGIPMKVKLNATGKNESNSVNLDYDTVTISSPSSLIVRDVASSFTIDKTNSHLPDLVSMPPSVIRFSGSVKMNPLGRSSPSDRNNYIFGDSRFYSELEIEVPLEFWMNNLQFSDTVENFLKPDDSLDKNSFKAEDFDSLRLKISVNNGFPIGVSLKLMLYDSVRNVVLRTIDATDIIKPAAVDNAGKVTAKTESLTSIEFSKSFFDSIKKSDKIIFVFTLKTSGTGTTDVRIYSDYSLSFKASLIAKPNVTFN
jgi:hypothetical protein